MMLEGALGVSDITPDSPSPLSGFAVRTAEAQGALDALSVRALLLRSGSTVVALVSYDLIGVPDGLEASIHTRLASTIGRQDAELQLILCATHTHAGPPVLARAVLGVPDPAYLERLSTITAALLCDLLMSCAPLELQAAKAPVEGIAVNRRQSGGPLDPRADVITLHRAGQLSGIWVNYACHPVALGPDNLSYSADFPGAARACLEETFGVPVLFTTGCAGQINTGHRAEDSITMQGLERRTPQAMRALGLRLAHAVSPWVAAAVGEPVHQVHYRSHTLEVEFCAAPLEARAVVEQGHASLQRVAATPGERAMAQLDLEWARRSHPERLSLTLGVLSAGPLHAVFLPGEVFVETSLNIQAAFPGTAVTAYAYTNPGYIPVTDAYLQGGYEVDQAYRAYGLRSPFPPGTAEQLEQVACALLRAAP